MSIRSALLKVADKVRALPSRPSWDVWPTSLTIRVRTWEGGRIGTEGGTTDVDLVISPKPRVKDVSQREIAGSGGRYEAGDVRVGPITPQYAGGGYTPAQLAPPVGSNGVEVLYVLSGGISGEYGRVDLQTDHSLSYWLVLRRKRSTP
jgi:hypothetical protein